MSRRPADNYINFVRELQQARLSRRELISLGLVSGTGAFLAGKGFSHQAHAQGLDRVSPPTRPWIEELPIAPVKQPNPSISPLPQKEPNVAAGEVRSVPHQGWDRFQPTAYYEIHTREALHSFHRDLPPSTIWGHDGIFPGPTFHARYTQPIVVRFRNELPPDHVGFGIPEDITHLHNAHTPWESDGGPFEWYPSGNFRDHHFPNVHPAFSIPDTIPPEFQDDDGGDSRETLATLFYHAHRPDFTASNVYKGLVGFYLLFDPHGHDTGEETDPNPAAFRLPSGEFDVPLLFADKAFDADGQLFFDSFNLDGMLGDKHTVNGKIQPFLRVARRKYRFRLLNGGPARFYQVFLSNGQRFIQITNDGNFLPRPVSVESVHMGVAERMDVVVDFSNANIGDEIFLVNRLEQTDGRGPTGKLVSPGTPILKFVVDRSVPNDPSRVPDFFYELPPINLAEVVRTRTWRFDRTNGAWAVNGEFFDPDVSSADVRQNSAEIWVLQNNSGGWMHPIHLHLEECRILSRKSLNGAVPLVEQGRKDVVVLGHGEEVRIFTRFRDWLGKYPMHCHNITHEDHAMMLRWDVVPG